MREIQVQLIAIIHSKGIGFENVGLERIAAFLKQNDIPVKVSYLYYTQDIGKEMQKLDMSSNLFGISVYGQNEEFASLVAERIKKEDSSNIVMYGSKYATDYSEFILESNNNVDFISLGHGEIPILEFCNRFKEGESVDSIVSDCTYLISRKSKENKEIYYANINELPWPERNYLKENKSLHAYIADAHCCTGMCSFCSDSHSGRRWTGRSAEDIYEELIHLYENYSVRSFFFSSGSFEDPGIKGKQKIRKLCNLLEGYPVKFALGCYLRAESFKDTSEDNELLSLMRKVGFFNIFVGIEAANENDLLIYNKRASLEDNETSIKLLKRHNIFNNYGFIMLNPYSTKETLKTNCVFLAKHKCDFLSKYISRLYVYYNTPIYHKLKNDGLLKPNSSYKDYFSYNFKNKELDSALEFLNSNFYEGSMLNNAHISYADNVHFYYLVETLCSENIPDNLKDKFIEIQNNIAKDLEVFFTKMYVDGDLVYCKDNYHTFEKKMMVHYNEMNKLNMKLMLIYSKMKGR